jgi:ABC-type transport system involved in cytochrome c biogenesis permease subunit
VSDKPIGFWGRFCQSLPSLEQIDRQVYRGVAFGFPLLTLVIITGAVWAQYVWQRWWTWDPKETASLVTFLIYAGYLHGRRQRGWQGKTSAWIVLGGFIAVLFTFAGVNFLQSLHSYGIAAASPGGRLLGGFSDVSAAEAILTTGFFLCYLVGLLVVLWGAVAGRTAPGKGALVLPALGFLGNTLVIIIRTIEAQRLTFTSGYDFTLWFVWGIMLCGLIAALGKQRFALLGALPLALLIAMYGYLYFPQKGHVPLPPALQNKLWLHIHVAVAIFAYGALALAAGWSIIYLIKARGEKQSAMTDAEAVAEG